ncbi:MAG: putative dehydrogenase/threonine dehydrogenase-like Zn-dependent dehydrogenase [Limisphaerales bacterium]
MKQIAQYQDGRLEVQEVPLPTAPPGGALVRVTHSVISVGTEKMKVEQAKMNLLQKAKARPDQVRKVLETAKNLGWRSALEKVRNRLSTPTPLGYSAAGIVEHVDPGNTRFSEGDRVACAGAECAFHAEFIAQPDLLLARVPDGVESSQAAYTTLVSIALQAVRQTDPKLGDRILVLGQGLIGLLATNLLAINGARVMAVDLLASRRSLCEKLGAEKVVIPGEQDLAHEVNEWTDGFGVDAVVVCTAAQSNGPIDQAIDSLRDRGRIVIVGNTHTEFDWKRTYAKELEIRYSRSYGPGRYDPAYEFGGSDYPIGYVRWTETRNFDACLHLMRTGQLKLDDITTRRVAFENCLDVYRELSDGGSADVGVVIEYADGAPDTDSAAKPESHFESPAPGKDFPLLAEPVTALDVIGAGNFARTMLLPHLKSKVPFGMVVNQTALSANHVKDKFGFTAAETDAGKAWNSDGTRGVIIATRHHLHAPLVTGALAANRHVFVEKPLCLRREELTEIDEALRQSTGSLQIGFNRRFAPASIALRSALHNTPGPKSASFRVNAGKLAPDHWYANHAESGGRVLGEACHFFDYFCFLFASRPVKVFAQTVGDPEGQLAFPDSVTAQIDFADGSSGQLIYTGAGDPSWPKEMLTVFGAGIVAELENFQTLMIHRNRKKTRLSENSKGHAEQMAGWAGFLAGTGPHLFPYEQGRQSMELTFAAMESLRTGRAVTL